MFIFLLLICSILMLKVTKIPFSKITGKEILKYSGITVCLYIGSVVFSFICLNLGIGSTVNVNQAKENYGLRLMLFLVVIVSPLLEEFLFRFGVIEIITMIMKKTKADKLQNKIIVESFPVLMSAFCFSMAHSGGSIQNLYTFVLGLYLAYLYKEKQNLGLTIGLHALFNSISMGLLVIGEYM